MTMRMPAVPVLRVALLAAGAVGLIGLGAVAAYEFLPARNSGNTQQAAAATPAPAETASAAPQPSGQEVIKDAALQQAAFEAAFPTRERAVYGGQGCDVPPVYKPSQLIRIGATYVLVSTSTTPAGSDNAEQCFGSANVAYLDRTADNRFTLRSEKTYDEGHASGYPPDTAINEAIAAWPVLVLGSGPASEQGCTSGSTDLVGLTPEGPRELATFVSTYSPDAGDDSPTSGFEAAIEPGADKVSFRVVYTGAVKRTVVYRVNAQGQYQADQAAPSQTC